MRLSLSYKSGDAYLASAIGRSNQLAMFIDSTGRVYSVMAGTLPSARGQGEPLSSRFKPPDGAEFCGAMIGDNEQKYLLASDAGYGFVATLEDLVTRNKAGKAILRVPPGGRSVVPAPVPQDAECLIAAVTSIGRLLMFEMDELPELAKGKGNKLINIPAKKYKSWRRETGGGGRGTGRWQSAGFLRRTHDDDQVERLGQVLRRTRAARWSITARLAQC